MSILLNTQVFAADVQISQLLDNPDPAVRGGDLTYSVYVENNADDTASDVLLTIPLPATTTFVSVAGYPGCAHDGGTPGTVTCNIGDLIGTGIGGPVIQIDLVIQTTAATPSTINITANVATSSTDTNMANNDLTQNTTIDDGADLIVSKSDTPDPVIAGGEVTYQIDVFNNGPNNAYTITLEDTLPTNMDYVSASGPGWSCSESGGVVTCQRASINSGETAPAITLVGEVTGAVTGTITNSVTVSADTEDPNINNNTITEDTQVTEGTDLSISKITVGFVVGGETAQFRLRPRNRGPFDAQNVVVTDTLPAGFTYISATGNGWSCSHDGGTPGTITCTRPTYSVGATNNITVQATTPSSGTNIINATDITATTPDPDSSNNTSSVTFDIVPDGADLSISKNKSPDPVALGSNITSTFVVTNNGPQATSGTLTLTDTLPAGETYVSFSGNFWSCSESAGLVTCTYSDTPLAAGDSTEELTITTIAGASGTLTNTGNTYDDGGQTDGVPGNNSEDQTVTSTPQRADLSIIKDAITLGGDTTLSTGETTIIYTLYLENNGPDTSTSVQVTDNVAGYVPGGSGTTVSVVDENGKFSSCGNSYGTVTCNGATFASGETGMITISVTRPLFDGPRTNTASIHSTAVGDPDRNNNSDTATVNIEPVTDVVMQSKTVSPNPVTAGTEATYVLTFRNRGPSTAQNVVVTDNFTLPVGGDTDFTFISATPAEGSCSWDNPTRTLTCNGIELNRNESRTITTVIRPNWQSTDPVRYINNTAEITTTTVESNVTNNNITQILEVHSSDLDLLVNKTDLVDPIGYDGRPGFEDNNIITYRVVITNRGPSLATGVILSDDMTPKNGKTLRFLGDRANTTDPVSDNADDICDNFNNTVSGPGTMNISCNCPDLDPNTTYTRYLDFRVESAPDIAGDTHNNISTVSCNEVDRLAANDSEAETTSVRQRVDLEVSKAPSDATPQILQPFNWTITVFNNGPGHSLQTDLTDTLPTNMEFYGAAPSSTSGTCSTSGSDLTCDLGRINSGETVTVTVPVRMIAYPGVDPVENCATATTSEVEVDDTNNEGCGEVAVQKSSLSGYVYRDFDDDGDMETGEAGISGVTLTLTGTDAYGNAVNETTTTDGTGAYFFDNLPPSDGTGYTVTEMQPAIYFFDGLDSNDDGATAIPGSRTTDVISGIPVPENTALTGYLFGEIPAASISGHVWHDENNDGIRDAAETTGIQNVDIRLTGTDNLGNPVDITTNTGADGSYNFGPLRPSDANGYTVTETQPADWLDGMDRAGSVGGAVGNDTISVIVLGATTNATGYDFGEQGGRLAGTVYNDLNNNGSKEIDEPGIPGVTVTLTGTDIDGTSVNLSTTTASDGSYSFTGLLMPVGAGYTITESQPAGWTDGQETLGTLGGTIGSDTFSGISFSPSGFSGVGYDFGEIENTAGIARISGRVWLDINHNRIDDDGNPRSGWTVELVQRPDPLDYSSYILIASTTTDASGNYAFEGLSPGTYEILFRHPSAGYIYGVPVSTEPGVDLTYGTIRNLSVAANDNILNQNLPLDPSGVVYNSITRDPVEGATVTISGPAGFNPATDLVGGNVNISQLTDATGQYQFLLFPSAPAGDYTLTVTAPAGYLAGNSIIIPPCDNILVVDAAPSPALVQNNATPPGPGTTLHTANSCPTSSAGLAPSADTTQYFLSFTLNPGVSANVVNNHIPIDPILGGSILLSKSTKKKYASIGDLVPYTIVAKNQLGAEISPVTIQDKIPAGFKYVKGSAMVNGEQIEPRGDRVLRWTDLTIEANSSLTISYILVVGTGVNEGNIYKNRAIALTGLTGLAISNYAVVAVEVVGDPIFSDSLVIGKVFNDLNGDGDQQVGEAGIPGVRIASVSGLLVTTDAYGRYHIDGIKIKRFTRGRNFILKADPATLPPGTIFTTENPRVIRITQGLLQKINFGVQLPANGDVQKPGSEKTKKTGDQIDLARLYNWAKDHFKKTEETVQEITHQWEESKTDLKADQISLGRHFFLHNSWSINPVFQESINRLVAAIENNPNIIVLIAPANEDENSHFDLNEKRIHELKQIISKKFDSQDVVKGVTFKIAKNEDYHSVDTITNLGSPKDASAVKPNLLLASDSLQIKPVLNAYLQNEPVALNKGDWPGEARFFIYTNYPDYIVEWKLEVFGPNNETPLKIFRGKKVRIHKPITWDLKDLNGNVIKPDMGYAFKLTVYDSNGKFDYTRTRTFDVKGETLLGKSDETYHLSEDLPYAIGIKGLGSHPKQLPFDMDNTDVRHIVINGGQVTLYGEGLSKGSYAHINGEKIYVDRNGKFVRNIIKPAGKHDFDVHVTRSDGKEHNEVITAMIKGRRFFMVGIADLTVGQTNFKGHVEPTSEEDEYDDKVYADGRIAFYLKGKIKGKYLLTAQADTGEEPLDKIIERMDEKDPRSIFRRLDPDRYYPVYGDDSVTKNDVDTQGKFFVRLEWDHSNILWGNYLTAMNETDLTSYNRSLYGAKAHLETVKTTRFGDHLADLTAFWADAQTIHSRDVMRATGGSLYYLKHGDIVIGSEQIIIEVRDDASGLVSKSYTLEVGRDYEIDWLQGRVILARSLESIMSSGSLISNTPLAGEKVYLVAEYEYDARSYRTDHSTYGFRASGWAWDYLRFGGTFVEETRTSGNDYQYYGFDSTVKPFKGTTLDMEWGQSERKGSGAFLSNDGGLTYEELPVPDRNKKSNAYKVSLSADIIEWCEQLPDFAFSTVYAHRDKGYSTSGQETLNDIELYSIELKGNFLDDYFLFSQYSVQDEKDASRFSTATFQLGKTFNERLNITGEFRYQEISDPGEEDLTDSIGALQVHYRFTDYLDAYLGQQFTLYRTDETPENNRTFLGVGLDVTENLHVDIEGSAGNLGEGVKIGGNYKVNDDHEIYGNWQYLTGRHVGRNSRTTIGNKGRVSDKVDIYTEHQINYGTYEQSISDIFGLDYAPKHFWTLSASYSRSVVDKKGSTPATRYTASGLSDTTIPGSTLTFQTGNKSLGIIDRDIITGSVAYDHDDIKYKTKMQVRFDRGDDDANQYVLTNYLDWNFRNNMSLLLGFDFSLTRNLDNDIDDARFMEGKLGLAYRPVYIDKLNLIGKYSFLEDLAPIGQEDVTFTDERSHVLSVEGIYDLTKKWQLGEKFAYKRAELRADRHHGEWFHSDTYLFASRVNYHFIYKWDALLEYRMLWNTLADDCRQGFLVGLYRHVGKNAKIGVGYNFTDFDDDLTNLDYETGGVFINFIGKW